MVTDKNPELTLGAGPTTGNMMISSVYTRSLTRKNTASVPASDYNVVNTMHHRRYAEANCTICSGCVIFGTSA